MLVSILQRTGAVGILRSVGVDLAEVQARALFAYEEAPDFFHLLAVGTGNGHGGRVLILAQRGSGGVAGLSVLDGGRDSLAIQCHGDGRIGAGIDKGSVDLRLGLIAGCLVRRREDRRDQWLVGHVQLQGVGELNVQRILDDDLDAQAGMACQLAAGDGEAADHVFIGHGSGLGRSAGIVEPIGGGGGGDAAQVVHLEFDLAVRADLGLGILKLDGGVDHIAAVVLVLNLVEVHGVDVGIGAVIGIAGEHVVKVLQADTEALPGGCLVIHAVAAVDGLQAPLGILAGGVNEDEGLIVDRLALVVDIVLGHGQIFAAGLEQIVISVLGDVKDQRAVADVAVGQCAALQRGRSRLQALLGSVGVGLTEAGLGIVVVDYDLVAGHGQSRSFLDIAYTAVGIGVAAIELELEVLGVFGLIRITAEVLALIAFQIDVGLIGAEFVFDIHNVISPVHSGLVGNDGPLCALLGGVAKHQLFRAGRSILDDQILAAVHEVIGAVGVLDELDGRCAVGQSHGIIDNGNRLSGSLSVYDVITHDLAVPSAAGIDHAGHAVFRHSLIQRGSVAYFRCEGHGGKQRENHGKGQQPGQSSREMLFHVSSSFRILYKRRTRNWAQTHL